MSALTLFAFIAFVETPWRIKGVEVIDEKQ
jgi:hypothetical protein